MEREKMLNLPDKEKMYEVIGMAEDRGKGLQTRLLDFIIASSQTSDNLNSIWNDTDMSFEEKVWLTFEFGRLVVNPFAGCIIAERKKERGI